MDDETKSWAIPEERLKRGYKAGELFLRLKLVESPELLAGLIANKAVAVNGEVVTDTERFIGLADVKDGKIILAAGKESAWIVPAVLD